MPKVPIVDQPSVRQAPLAGFRQNLQPDESKWRAVGEGIKRTAQMASSVVGGIQEDKAKADAARTVQEIGAFTRDADQQLMDPTIDPATEVTDPTTGKTTGKPIGYKHLNGEDAFGSREEYVRRINDLAQTHEDALSNDEQKAAFRAQAYGKITGYHNEIQSHAGMEADRAISTGFKVGRDAELSHLRGVAEDPKSREDSLGTLDAINLSEARRIGLASTDQEAFVKNGRVEANASVMDALLVNDKLPEAEEFYAKAKDNLGDKSEQIARRLEEKRTQSGVDAQASGIMKDSILPGYSWVNRQKAFDAVDALPDGPKKERTRALVEHQVEKIEKLREETADKYLSFAQAIYFKAGGTLESSAMSDVKEWLLDPNNGAGDRWMRLVKDDHMLRQQANGVVDKSQDKANALALSNFNALDDGEKATIDIGTRYLGQADEKTRNVMTASQKKVKRIIDGGGEAALGEIRTFAESEAVRAGRKGPDAKDFAASLRAWGVNYMADPKNNGRAPTQKEMQLKVADELLMVREKDGWLYNAKMTKQEARKRGTEVVPLPPENQPYEPNRATAPVTLQGKMTKEPAKDIPAGDRDEIVKVLSKKGIAPTEENIRTMYQRSLGR